MKKKEKLIKKKGRRLHKKFPHLFRNSQFEMIKEIQKYQNWVSTSSSSTVSIVSSVELIELIADVKFGAIEFESQEKLDIKESRFSSGFCHRSKSSEPKFVTSSWIAWLKINLKTKFRANCYGRICFFIWIRIIVILAF